MRSSPENPEITSQLFLESGLSFLMIKIDGSKAPITEPPDYSWDQWKERMPTGEDAARWFGGGKSRGIGMIAGKVSGNVEVIDMESVADRALFRTRIEEQRPGLLGRLLIVRTPSDGRHLIYRCATVEPNQKLAFRVMPCDADKKGARKLGGGFVEYKVMIETRGEGGYVVAPGSPARCHHSNRPYRLVQGDYRHIPEITAADREILLAVAQSMDEAPEADVPQKSEFQGKSRGLKRPGDDFSDRATGEGVAHLLKAAGWEIVKKARRGGDHWRRPGKDDGWSATLFESGVLHVFTSSAYPFEPEQSYSPFQVLALLAFNGDFQAARAAIEKLGYGSPDWRKAYKDIGHDGQ